MIIEVVCRHVEKCCLAVNKLVSVDELMAYLMSVSMPTAFLYLISLEWLKKIEHSNQIRFSFVIDCYSRDHDTLDTHVLGDTESFQCSASLPMCK